MRDCLHTLRGLAVIGIVLMMAVGAVAQIQFDAEKDIPLSVAVSPAAVPAGGDGVLKVSIGLPANFHITSRDNGFFFVTPDSGGPLTWRMPSFPAGETLEGDTVYHGKVAVSVPFTLASSSKAGDQVNLTGTVGYQVCSETAPIFCAAPVERHYSTSFTVGTKGAISAQGTTGDGGEPMTVEMRAKKALERGSLAALIWVFIGGVLLSFTPCVYPVIPITIAYIGAHSGASKLKGFTLSLFFVLGLAIVYSTLGVVAAATGGVFGLSTQNPWVVGFVTIVFLVMGTGMLGAFDIQLPSSLQSVMVSKKRSGYVGALFVGATTGLVAAPCVGPVLVALLGWVASTGKIFAGFIYLFVFACGLGSLFVVIGTFAGALAALPKAGGWMERVKHVFGVLMIAVAYYMARSLVPVEWFQIGVGLGLLSFAALIGGFSRLDPEAEIGAKLVKAMAVFLIVVGVFYSMLGLARVNGVFLNGVTGSGPTAAASTRKLEGSEAAGVPWFHDDETGALAASKESGKPIMIDFWAEWCVACKELDRETFSDAQVAKLISDRFVPLKVDGTKPDGPVKELWARYGVKGLPTVLFLSPDGKEIARFEAFRTVEQALPVMKKAAGV